MKGRIDHIDGLRGFAVALVVGWHFCGPSEAEFLPYGDRYGFIPLLNRGWIGVELFFLISGYVIFLTLENSRNFPHFILRRWLRLFPAMLIVSPVLFASTRIFSGQLPGGMANWIDFLPGLSLISPSFYHAVLDSPVASLDNVFWSLYVEAAFYVVAGLSYFRLGWQKTIALLIIIAGLMFVVPVMMQHLPPSPLKRAIEPFEWAGFQYFGWFASGALFYKSKQQGSFGLFVGAVAIGALSALTFTSGVPIDPISRVFLFVAVCLFAAAERSVVLQNLIANPVLLFLGFISYPLYLIHNRIGLGLLSWIARSVPSLPMGVTVLIVLGFLLGLGWIIARYAEPWLRSWISGMLHKRSKSTS